MLAHTFQTGAQLKSMKPTLYSRYQRLIIIIIISSSSSGGGSIIRNS